MFQISLLAFTLWGGILIDPFRISGAEVGHHQINLQAAIASDGHFAIAWVDSVKYEGNPSYKLDLYIRFFDNNGNSLTPACRLPKLYDTAWVNRPTLDMDSVGNAVLVWQEGILAGSEDPLPKIRFQRFTPEGTFVSLPKTLCADVDIGRMGNVSLSNNGVFAITFTTMWDIWSDSSGVWVQRFNLDGVPQGSAFRPHDSYFKDTTASLSHPKVALNENDELLVTWLEVYYTAHMYPRYQVFDRDDKPILAWEPRGHPLDDGDTLAGACSPQPFWIDDDRFVVFYTDYTLPGPMFFIPFASRVFSQKGAVGHTLCKIMYDSLWYNGQDRHGRFSSAVLPDGRFVHTHTRIHNWPGLFDYWEHASGFLGEVVNNEPWRKTNLFEYSAPWGNDTTWCNWNNWFYVQTPAVAACNDRLIWVYPRFNPDTVFEAWAVITDWDMGENIAENPLITQPDFEIANPIGREIVLRYSDCPQGFSASIFDVSGRRVDELYAPTQSGTLAWGNNKPSGVYFIVPQGLTNPMKVILAR